jgi:hypothetical protein
MPMIHVPKPPKSAFNPKRPVSALLKSQMDYLQHAERRLPLRYRSEIYVNAIKTEGEAANYIRHVTQAIHEAHSDAAAARTRVGPKRKRVIEIAAVADERAERQRAATKHASKKKNKKKSGGKSGRKK